MTRSGSKKETIINLAKKGLVFKEIVKETGYARGTVSSGLAWARANGVIGEGSRTVKKVKKMRKMRKMKEVGPKLERIEQKNNETFIVVIGKGNDALMSLLQGVNL